MASLDDLLPCPFCGGYAEFERMGTHRASCIVACQECGCRLESNETWPNSGKQWNKRVDIAPKRGAQEVGPTYLSTKVVAEDDGTGEPVPNGWKQPTSSLSSSEERQ